MPAPTSITVTVDNTEYSQYEEGNDTITATVTISGGAPYAGEEILVELTKARRSRDAVVEFETLTFTSSDDTVSQDVTFDLPNIVDSDLISLIRHGKYFVKGTHEASSLEGESDDFDIRIMTVEKFKQNYLFGLPLEATNVKKPKFQPSGVTGVTVVEVSSSHPSGFAPLTYSYTENDTDNAEATIGAGANGTVTIEADGEAVAGTDGNGLDVAVVVPAGTSALGVSFDGSTLTVNLAVTAGVPTGGANTATLIAAAITALDEFTATASGTGADEITAAETDTFTGGTTDIIRSLSWRGGPTQIISSAGTYILQSGSTGPASKIFASSSNDYICVKVGSLSALPSSSVVDNLLIEQEKMDDEALGCYLQQAIDWIEQDYLAGVYLEPTNVVTDRDPTTIQYTAGISSPNPFLQDTDYDYIVSPLTYFIPRDSDWINIQTPYRQLLRVDSLFGAIANTRVIDIDLEWIEHSEQGGLIQLVPFNQEIAFDFIGLIWVNAIRGAVELPNFWHFNMIVGLRKPHKDLMELIGRKAAVNVLTYLAQAFRPGIGSQSLSRDGVSQSTSYLAQQQYGIYTGAINAHNEWLEKNDKLFRAKYRGLDWAVV